LYLKWHFRELGAHIDIDQQRPPHTVCSTLAGVGFAPHRDGVRLGQDLLPEDERQARVHDRLLVARGHHPRVPHDRPVRQLVGFHGASELTVVVRRAEKAVVGV